MATIDDLADPISLDDHRGGSCGIPDCPCAKPSHWPTCDEWMGIEETGEFCPRCGWTRRCHPDFDGRPDRDTDPTDPKENDRG